MEKELPRIDEIIENLTKRFDLRRLKSDLENAQRKNITDRPWEILVATLAGYSDEEVAKITSHTKGAVKTERDRSLKPPLQEILKLDKMTWTKLTQKIIEAGYGLEQETCITTLDKEVFRNMLDKQRNLSANSLINANFEVLKLYISLGLVESKKQERRKDVNPEMGSRLYQPEEYEVTRKFENDEFLTEVLLQGNSPKSQGKRIVIIGEPGSGKTTRLQQVADRLFNENDENLVIWVSLADLQDRNLEDFLLNTWLKEALKQKEASEESQDKLIEKFNEGNVWLLLDGLDEMRLDHNPLYWVNSQIKGWIESAKVILTCRVNVWESGNNYLSHFDVYRNLDFSESQRDEFIYKFFTDRSLAEQLITALNQDGKERIRDLVKNPLRLTLICYSWEKHQGSLPGTKAGLYQECVEAFYLWKEVKFKTTIAQRKSLNQALGELAKQALEQESSKFRLTHSFICEVLGQADEGLFKLALELGWLNRVGVAEEDPTKQVYAFFHPSFQEYFASLVLDDWDYFIPRTQSQLRLQSVLDGNYRIFNNYIKEVSMYWIGRDNIHQDSKQEFIKTLLNFNSEGINITKHSKKEDPSNLIYNILVENRAYSIAIELFSELPVSACQPNLIGEIIAVMCSHVFNYNKYKVLSLDIETSWLYKEALAKLKTNSQLAFKIIDHLLENQYSINEWAVKYNVLDLLDQVSVGSDKTQTLINELLEKVTQRGNDYIQWKFVDLTQKYISATKAQEILRNIIRKNGSIESHSKFLMINCLYTLEKLKVYNEDKSNILTISELLSVIRQTKSAKICDYYLYALYEKILVESEDLDALKDVFDLAMELLELKAELVESKFPEDNDYVENYDENNNPCDTHSQDSYLIKDRCLYIAEKIIQTHKNWFVNMMDTDKILSVIRQTESAKACRVYLCILSEKVLVESKELDALKEDIFDLAIELLSLKDEFIKPQFPEDNNYSLFPERSDKYGDYGGVVCYYENSDIIKGKCSDIAEKVIQTDKNEFMNVILHKIEDILKIDLDFQSPDFRYISPFNASNPLLKLYEKAGGKKNKKLFLAFVNCLANQQKFIFNTTNNSYSQLDSIIYEFFVYDELNSEEKASIENIINGIIHLVHLSTFIFLDFLRLTRYEKRSVNRSKITRRIFLSPREPQNTQEKIKTNFQPRDTQDIILLTDALLCQNIRETFIYEDKTSSEWLQEVKKIQRVKPIETRLIGEMALFNLEQTTHPKLLQEIVTRLKVIFISPENFDATSERQKLCFKALWHCATRLSYQDFYKAWNPPQVIHPEMEEVSPVGHTETTKMLNQKIIDLPSQLKPTAKTYPIVINAQSLEDETDNSSIAQELCNQIYATVFSDETNIPEINNAPQLKRLIPNIKKQLNTQNLALIFHNGEPNESLTKFCKKLTDTIPIKWITKQPIEYGLRPHENLVNTLQNWINRLD